MLQVWVGALLMCVCVSVVQVCTNKMNLGDEVDLEDYVSRPDKISAAEIAAICQEAGMHAVSGGLSGWDTWLASGSSFFAPSALHVVG